MSQNIFSDKPAHDLYDFEMIGDDNMLIGVPATASPEVRRNLLAGLKAALYGYKSIDYVLKTFGVRWQWKPLDDERREFHNTIDIINDIAETYSDLLFQGGIRPNRTDRIKAEVALTRLRSTYRSASVSIAMGHPFEAAAICRTILELSHKSSSILERPVRFCRSTLWLIKRRGTSTSKKIK